MSPGWVVGLLVVVLPLGFALVFLPCGSFVSVLLVGLGGVVVVCPSPVALGSFGSWSGWVVPFFGTWLGLIWCLRVFRTVCGTLVSVSCFGFGFFISVKWIWQCISSRGFSFLVFVLFQWCQLRTCQHSFMSDEIHLQQKPSARVIRHFWGSRPISEGKFPNLIWNILVFSLCGTDAYPGWNY